MKFDDGNIRSKATQKLENVEQVSRNRVEWRGELWREVMIYDVHEEETGDMITETLKQE